MLCISMLCYVVVWCGVFMNKLCGSESRETKRYHILLQREETNRDLTMLQGMKTKRDPILIQSE